MTICHLSHSLTHYLDLLNSAQTKAKAASIPNTKNTIALGQMPRLVVDILAAIVRATLSPYVSLPLSCGHMEAFFLFLFVFHNRTGHTKAGTELLVCVCHTLPHFITGGPETRWIHGNHPECLLSCTEAHLVRAQSGCRQKDGGQEVGLLLFSNVHVLGRICCRTAEDAYLHPLMLLRLQFHCVHVYLLT